MAGKQSAVPVETIEKRIFLMRGLKVMLTTVLAELYRVEPRVLLQAVKRNIERFPENFMFHLSAGEFANLRSQSVILKRGQNIKHLPYAFTEQGVAMLSSVLQKRLPVVPTLAVT